MKKIIIFMCAIFFFTVSLLGCSNKSINYKTIFHSSIAYKDSNEKSNNSLNDVYLFKDKKSFLDFGKEHFNYFNNISLEDNISFNKEDILLIKCKWENDKDGPSYKVNSIKTDEQGMKIYLEVDESNISVKSDDKNVVCDYYILVALEKGKAASESKIRIEIK